jgi:hypothetical protein
MDQLDHRDLLLKYMALVTEHLGQSLVDAEGLNVKLALDERAALKRIEAQARTMLRR